MTQLRMHMSVIMKATKNATLSDLPPGCKAKVRKIEGAGNMRNRLLAMGFTPDVDIEIISCDCGRQVVKVRGCSMILDENVASRVTCAPMSAAVPAAAKKD